MPTVRRKYNPDRISDQVEGPFPLRLVRLCMRELYEAAFGTSGDTNTSGTVGGGGTSGSGSGKAEYIVEWTANGPYRVDTDVDGAWIVPVACNVTTAYLWRGTAGSSGQTVLDLNRRHINEAAALKDTLYITQANRPLLAYDDADGVAPCNLPDIVSLQPGDVVTIDCDERDSGRPYDFRFTLHAVAA